MNSQTPATSGSPAISVIMPLYNKAQYVERAVESVLAQDYLDYELLIVDDGSTDDGMERVQSRFNDPRVKTIRQPNAGAGAARNRGLRESRGEICAFLDADDEWYQTHLSDLLDLAIRFPEAGILATRFAWTFGDKWVANQGIRTGEPCLVHDYFARSAPPGEPFINASSCGVRRDVMRAVGDFLEATPYGEDQEYWARIGLSYALAFHPRVSAIYHYGTPGSAMSTHQWSAAEMPVVRTLKRYLESRPNTAVSADVLNYAAWIILNQAASGIASGESRTVDRLLADAIVTQSRFQHRRQVLRIAAALPTSIARRVFRIHNTTWLGPWRKIYFKVTSQDGAGPRTNNRESARIGPNSGFHTQ
jgi:glycosyltransferase involved in cell wall biosynthesis